MTPPREGVGVSKCEWRKFSDSTTTEGGRDRVRIRKSLKTYLIATFLVEKVP